MNKSRHTIGYKPYTASRRFMTREDYSEITKKTPHKSLLAKLQKHGGRDNLGHISIRHQGGQSKRFYRIISRLDEFLDKPAKIVAIEYDPNRSGRIALLEFADKKKIYILAPAKLTVGDSILASEKTPVKIGNRMKLKNISTGAQIYDIQTNPGSKNGMVRSAGSLAMVLALAEGEGKRGNYMQVKLPSGEIRLIHKECFASIGQVSNILHSTVKIGKAGRSRWMGIRPTTRGKAQNPVDHPHGGGEGSNSVGLKYPKTPWGKPAMGKITRKNKRTNKFIVRRKRAK